MATFRFLLKRIRNTAVDAAVRATAYLLPRDLICHARYFHVWERHGYHVTPANYYSPIPKLSEMHDALWAAESELLGIHLNEDAQLTMLREFSKSFHAEYEAIPSNYLPGRPQFYMKNGMFLSVDAEILYCMIRSFKPRRILEAGAGQSTLLAAEAVLRNQAEDPSYACELIAVEPYPNGFLRDGFPGLSRLMVSRVQDLPLTEFEQLEKDDILFVDSSHVAAIGSDVNFLIAEVLPRLKPGVLIHFHDIFFPSEYPQRWVKDEMRFWNEQYVLQAFLSFNSEFTILWAGHFMHKKHSSAVSAAFCSYNPNSVSPASLWIRRVG